MKPDHAIRYTFENIKTGKRSQETWELSDLDKTGPAYKCDPACRIIARDLATGKMVENAMLFEGDTVMCEIETQLGNIEKAVGTIEYDERGIFYVMFNDDGVGMNLERFDGEVMEIIEITGNDHLPEPDIDTEWQGAGPVTLETFRVRTLGDNAGRLYVLSYHMGRPQHEKAL